VLEWRLAAYPFVVDERSVEAAEVSEDPSVRPYLNDAVLFGDNLVEELDRVVRMPPKRIYLAKVDRLLALGGLQNQASHRSWKLT
jgi:hypothetical protein